MRLTSVLVQPLLCSSWTAGVSVPVLWPYGLRNVCSHTSPTRLLATGKAHILDQTVDVVALHKERYIFPVTLAVTKVSGTGADATFMSVMKVRSAEHVCTSPPRSPPFDTCNVSMHVRN